MIRYDTIEEFNVDSKLSVFSSRKKYKKKKLKQTNVSAHLVQYRSKIREGEGSPDVYIHKI